MVAPIEPFWMGKNYRISKKRRAIQRKRLIEFAKAKVRVGLMTDTTWEFSRIEGPYKNSLGKWVFKIHWKPTEEEPEAVIDCVKYLRDHVPNYQRKKDEFVERHLLQMIRDNQIPQGPQVPQGTPNIVAARPLNEEVPLEEPQLINEGEEPTLAEELIEAHENTPQ